MSSCSTSGGVGGMSMMRKIEPFFGGAMPILVAARSAVPEMSAGVWSVTQTRREVTLRFGRTTLCGLAPSNSTTALPSLSTVVTTRRMSSLSGMQLFSFAAKRDRLSASRLVHRVAARHRAHNLDVLDLVRVDRVRIVREHHEIGELAGRDRALDRFLVRGVGAVDGEHAQRLVDADALIGAPGLAVPALARHHALHAHHRRERSGAEIRAGR